MRTRSAIWQSSSSEQRALVFGVTLLAASAFAPRAAAQVQPTQGFAVERFTPSAPGAGWFVMDDLGMRGGLGGAMALTAGYAKNPLQVTGDSRPLAVVSDQAFTDFGVAVTYDRWRLYLNMDAPFLAKGQSGTIGNYQFTAPCNPVPDPHCSLQHIDLGTNPDTMSDARVGLDARLLGGPKGPLRLGASAQLFVPEGSRTYYDSDGTVRAMLRALLAGDLGLFAYAGQLGVHIRPLDDSPTPGSPQGSELLFGVAAGAKVPMGPSGALSLVVGPEIFGATAFRSFLGSSSTALEGLLTGRLEGTADDGPQLRVKLGTGAGIDPHFGAPEWRLVFAIELFDRSAPAAPVGKD
jgi:hypothetical protein